VSEPLPAGLVEALATPGAYPEDSDAVAGVTHVQTHISHVFLTRTRVYKLRKAVAPVFLDFSRRDERNDDCVREVRLNRRLAPDVYLGVAPVVPGPGGFRIGSLGEALRPGCEHVVVMRRLPAGHDALTLLGRGALGREALEAAAERVARFHAEHGLGRPAPFAPDEWLARIDRPMQDNLHELALHGSGRAADVDALARAWAGAYAVREARLEERRLAGRAVDGHGDLHLAHCWFEDEAHEPLFVDCIEFSDALRRIDAAADVAFLAMDLGYRDQPALAEAFLSRYAEAADDAGLYGVVDLYAAYRAAVRAKVAALASDDAAIDPAQRRAAAESRDRHLAYALRLLDPPARGALVLVGGSVATGKSSVARALSAVVPAAVIASDRLRKRLEGRAIEAPAPAALYAPERVDAVYAALLARAEPALASGRRVLLDATWAKRRHRDAARALGARLGVPVSLVHVDCPAAVARDRAATRAKRGGNPSDAGPERVAPSRAAFEPPEEWPPVALHRFGTDRSDWPARIPALVEALRGGPG